MLDKTRVESGVKKHTHGGGSAKGSGSSGTGSGSGSGSEEHPMCRLLLLV